MNDSLTMAMLGFTLMCIIGGFLLGLLRGMNRSILRFILIIACAVGAFALKDVIANSMLNMKIGGQTIPEMMQAAIAEGGNVFPESLSNFILAFASLLVGIVGYFICFFILQGFSWLIIFPICKIFVKKGVKKRALMGGAIGLVQGVVIAFVVLVPMTGFLIQVDKLSTAFNGLANGGEQVAYIEDEVASTTTFEIKAKEDIEQGEEGNVPPMPVFDLKPFINSPLCKFYDSVGHWYFTAVSTTKDAEGNKVSLEATTNVVTTMVKLSANVQNISSAIEGISDPDTTKAEALSELGDLLISIGEDYDALGADGVELFDRIVDGVKELILPEGSESEMPKEVEDAIKDFSIEDFNLKSAGQAFIALSHYADDMDNPDVVSQITKEDAHAIIVGIADNSFILGLAGENQIMNVPNEDKATFIEAIEEVENISAQDKQLLYKMFNLD